MEKPANQLVEEGAQEAHNEAPNFNLELLQDKFEYLNVKANFFENQTLIFNKIIHKMELKDKEFLKEEQDLTDKLKKKAEVKINLVNILNGLKSQRKVKEHKNNDKTFIRVNGFYNCPECPYKTKFQESLLKRHINAVHRKLKPWKCSDCYKGKRIKTLN